MNLSAYVINTRGLNLFNAFTNLPKKCFVPQDALFCSTIVWVILFKYIKMTVLFKNWMVISGKQAKYNNDLKIRSQFLK